MSPNIEPNGCFSSSIFGDSIICQLSICQPHDCLLLDNLNKNTYLHGTNLPAGLACAKQVLDKDKTVAASRKHMILVSDGATYLFCNQNTDGTYNYQDRLTRVTDLGNQSGVVGTLSEWNIKHPKAAGDSNDYGSWTPEQDNKTWDEYLSNIKAKDLFENMKQYNQDYYPTDFTNLLPMKNSDITEYDPIINVEKSFAQAADIYKSMQDENYDCSTYFSDKVDKDGNLVYGKDGKTVPAAVSPIFTEFLDYLNGGETSTISSITNDIFYLLSTGSTITDYMGKSEAYDFNFVNDAANLVLTVNGTPYTTTIGTNLNTGEKAKYLFTSTNVTAKKATGATTEPEAPYVLHYYDGSDGTPERFVWEINEDVSEFARVQLTYSEKLTTLQSTAGDYSAYTNDVIANNQIVNPTILTPMDSNGKYGKTETFTSPVVKYTVLPRTDDKPSPAPVPTTNPTNNGQTTPTTDDRNERPNTPNTGDQTNAPLAASVLAVALLTCGLAFFFKKKYSN